MLLCIRDLSRTNTFLHTLRCWSSTNSKQLTFNSGNKRTRISFIQFPIFFSFVCSLFMVFVVVLIFRLLRFSAVTRITNQTIVLDESGVFGFGGVFELFEFFLIKTPNSDDREKNYFIVCFTILLFFSRLLLFCSRVLVVLIWQPDGE